MIYVARVKSFTSGNVTKTRALKDHMHFPTHFHIQVVTHRLQCKPQVVSLMTEVHCGPASCAGKDTVLERGLITGIGLSPERSVVPSTVMSAHQF